jgi:hypothetical protein
MPNAGAFKSTGCYGCCLRAPRSQPHSAHVFTKVTVHYRWHGLYGVELPCHRTVDASDGHYLNCQLPDGAGALIPRWMVDPLVCAGFSFGTPMASVEALVRLRSLLDSTRTRQSVQAPALGDSVESTGEHREL